MVGLGCYAIDKDRTIQAYSSRIVESIRVGCGRACCVLEGGVALVTKELEGGVAFNDDHHTDLY